MTHLIQYSHVSTQKDSDVGTYVITPTDCTFTSGVKNNYNIEYVNGTLSIYGSSYNKTSKTVKNIF